MALTRTLLKGMGLTEEQAGTIIEAHTETVDGLKADITKYKTDAEKLPGAQKELDDLKKIGDGGYKEKYEKEHSDFEKFKGEQAAKEARQAKETAYREVLKTAGVSEKRIDSIMKISTDIIEGLELSDGKVKDADKLTETVKTEWADFIVNTDTQGAGTKNPPENNPGSKQDLGSLSMKEYIAARKSEK